MIDVIYRAALRECFSEKCIGVCACCLHNYEALDGTESCALINEAPTANVVSKEAYDDLYAKYCELARLYNDAVSGIVKFLKSVTPLDEDAGGVT